MCAKKTKGLLERLSAGEAVVVAEGYVFELERRGYLKAGPFVPEVVLEHPDMVRSLYREFVHAGSDVVLAFTYYAHREKLSLIGREPDLERMNRAALRMAREVADESGCLMAGNICNTNLYTPGTAGDGEVRGRVLDMFKEQIQWAVEEGADFIVAETMSFLDESMAALEAIKQYGSGLPAVITMACNATGLTTDTRETFDVALRKLEEAGADVVGLNCHRGPDTMLPVLEAIREKCKGPIAALPVPYRTNTECPSFFTLKDRVTGERSFPADLDAHLCSRSEVSRFVRRVCGGGGASGGAVQYVGLCCGASPAMVRTVAEALGRRPPASRYSPHMEQHFAFGTDRAKLNPYNMDTLAREI